MDIGGGPGDLPRDESPASSRALMVEKNAIAGEHSIRLAVVDDDPVRI